MKSQEKLKSDVEKMQEEGRREKIKNQKNQNIARESLTEIRNLEKCEEEILERRPD